jgi:hypothetical protein
MPRPTDTNVDAEAQIADALTAEILQLVQRRLPTPSMGLLVLASAAAQLAYRNGQDKAELLAAVDSTYDLVAAKLGTTKGKT